MLTACMPATGPRSLNLQPVPETATWTPAALIERGEVPQALLRSLPDAIEQAPVGSIIIGCQRSGAMWGLCTHMTRKIAPGQLTEEPGPFQQGAGFRPASVLMGREVIIVLDVGVRDEHLPKLRAAADTLKGKPYFIGGQYYGYDCVTYQNALQRAVGLPEIATKHPRWNAFLPIGAVTIPSNRVLMVGMKTLPTAVTPADQDTNATAPAVPQLPATPVE